MATPPITWKSVSKQSDNSANTLKIGADLLSEGITGIGSSMDNLRQLSMDKDERLVNTQLDNFKLGVEEQMDQLRQSVTKAESSPLIGNIDINSGIINILSKDEYRDSIGMTKDQYDQLSDVDKQTFDTNYNTLLRGSEKIREDLVTQLNEIPSEKDVQAEIRKLGRSIGMSEEKIQGLSSGFKFDFNKNIGVSPEDEAYQLAAIELKYQDNLTNLEKEKVNDVEYNRDTNFIESFSGVVGDASGSASDIVTNALKRSLGDKVVEDRNVNKTVNEVKGGINDVLNSEGASKDPEMINLAKKLGFYNQKGFGVVPPAIVKLVASNLTFGGEGNILGWSDKENVRAEVKSALRVYAQYKESERRKKNKDIEYDRKKLAHEEAKIKSLLNYEKYKKDSGGTYNPNVKDLKLPNKKVDNIIKGVY